jgi:hypothetical protein
MTDPTQRHPLTPEDMAKEVSPLGRYAHGRYHCKCANCKRYFIGDKRATQCLPCAVGALLAAYYAAEVKSPQGDEALLSNGQQPDTKIDLKDAVRATGGGQ